MLLFFVSFFLCLSVISNAQERPGFLAEDVDFLWPTNSSYYMSSSFAETRSAHFHAALDIGTWGQIGYKIFATRDGILHRIGVSPTGYGNVIYLKHDDGSYSLYAHLDDFIPEIRNIVDSIRIKNNYRFEFDEVMEDHKLHFKRGDLIAYSGATGMGPPHLHFELRTPQGLPYNPLLTNLSVPDHIPPKFVSLSVEPLTMNSFVAGGINILQKRVEKDGSKNNFGVIPVKGSIGLGVDVYDNADGVNNVYAVYDLKLKINGDLYFHSRVDSFSYNDTHQMFLDRVYPILRETRRGFQRLYVKNSNRLPFYIKTKNNGVLTLLPGKHHFEIIASDYSGNTSSSEGYLEFIEDDAYSPDPEIPINSSPKFYSSNSLSATLQNWHWNNNWLAPKTQMSDFDVKVISPGSYRNTQIEIKPTQTNQAIDLSGNFSKIVFSDTGDPVILHRAFPDRKNTFYSVDQRASVTFHPGSVYDTMSVGLNYSIGINELPSLTVYPAHQPINKKARITFVLSGHLTKKSNLAFYYKNHHLNEYEMIDTHRAGSEIIGLIEHFDTFYVLEDSLGPNISEPQLNLLRDGNWKASVSVKDDLSGIDYHASEFYINNVRGIAEYDPEEDLLYFQLQGFKPSKHNKFQIIVADRVGNISKKSFNVRH
ncbi:MAG: M23 family metallopeptidase [Balneolales bacterium]